MTTTAVRPNKIHQGRNVKRFREMLGMKQEALAIALGEDWHQKRISLLEAKETLEPELLTMVSKALNIPEEAIRSFDEEKAVLNIQNNYEGANAGAGALINSAPYSSTYHDCTFNPLDKLMEAIEENKKLQEETKELYERLLASEREKVELLKGNKSNK